jgi:hypothetical protein
VANKSRFRDTGIWEEDWYCLLGGEYQRLWDYICDHCDNAGVWKPNVFNFEAKTRFKVNLDEFFKMVNVDSARVVKLKNGRWFLPGFILFQWFNKKKSFNLSLSNRLHRSLHESLINNEIKLTSVRGLKEVLKTSMVMDMEKEKRDLRNEEGAGEENHQRGEAPAQDDYVAAGILPDMLTQFTDENEGYPVDRKKDFPELWGLAVKLHKWLKLKGQPQDRVNASPIKTRWGDLVKHIRADKHFCKYSLSQINKHFQSIVQSFSNQSNGKQSNQSSRTSDTVEALLS